MIKKKNKNISVHEAVIKGMKYCAYQERCTFELEEKLKEWGISKDDSEKVIDELRNERFIDDFRFACALVRGKFNYKKWGRNKIYQKLREKKIPLIFIDEALKEIDEKVYFETLSDLATKKWKACVKSKQQSRLLKTFNFLKSKGYESELIWKILNKLKAETY